MRDYSFYSKEALLSLKPKNKIHNIIILSLILISLIILYNYQYYVSYNYIGVFNNDLIAVNIPYEKINKVLDNSKLLINDKKYKFKVQKISSLEYYQKSDKGYQKVYISTSNNFYDNQSLNITFYKKQRIVHKLFRLFS